METDACTGSPGPWLTSTSLLSSLEIGSVRMCHPAAREVLTGCFKDTENSQGAGESGLLSLLRASGPAR